MSRVEFFSSSPQLTIGGKKDFLYFENIYLSAESALEAPKIIKGAGTHFNATDGLGVRCWPLKTNLGQVVVECHNAG